MLDFVHLERSALRPAGKTARTDPCQTVVTPGPRVVIDMGKAHDARLAFEP
jgi:hypothetical protein